MQSCEPPQAEPSIGPVRKRFAVMSRKAGFVNSRLLEIFHKANQKSNDTFSEKTIESKIKLKIILKKKIITRCFCGMDTGSKEEEFWKIIFLFN